MLNFLASGQRWHIDIDGGLSALSNYYADRELLQSGASASDVYKDRREAAQMTVQKRGVANVAVIPLTGVMRLEGGMCAKGIQDIANEIRAINSDPSISAIVINANTPGGEAVAGIELFNAISEINKPVFVYAHRLASAGIMGTLAADGIYAASTQSDFGSVGVMMSIDNKIVQYLRENVTTLYSRNSPNKNEEFNALMEGDVSKYINALTTMDDDFMQRVANYRPLKGSESQKQETLSGRMFFAQDAQKRGLIDGIATLTQVIQMAAEEGIKTAQTKMRPFERRRKNKKEMANFFESLNQFFSTATPETDDQKKAIEAVNGQIQATQTEMQNIATELANLKTEREALTARVAGMETSMNDLNAKVQSLTSENAEMKTQIEALQSENTALKAERDTLKTELETASSKITNLSKELADERINRENPKRANSQQQEGIEGFKTAAKQAVTWFGGN